MRLVVFRLARQWREESFLLEELVVDHFNFASSSSATCLTHGVYREHITVLLHL